MGDDSATGLTIICFIGSVFSPYYAAARRRRPTPAEQHCAINVVLHHGGRQYWTMTERGPLSVRRDSRRMQVGNSTVEWDGSSLRYRLDERTFPLPGRVQGEVRFTPLGGGAGEHMLDAAGRHQWVPLAPGGRVEVNMESPRIRWSGSGYFDHNHGAEPLERAFRSWSWSRWTGAHSTLLHYDVHRLRGDPLTLRLKHCAETGFESLHPGLQQPLTRSGWRIARSAPADPGTSPRVLRTLVDAPFYTRSLLQSTLEGERITGIHESLSMERFASRWVQALLPFRMPRRELVPPG